MKLLILFTLSALAPSAFAINLTPKLDKPVCLQRVYSSAEMKKNPLQMLSELTVLVSKEKYEDGNDSDVFQTAMVVGRSVKNNKLYGNTAWHSGSDKKGNDLYQIDCDGGSFSLVKRSNGRQEWANFTVTKDYYFPLFNGVLQPDFDNMDQSDYQISLDGNDSNNNVWRLEQVPVHQCEEKIEQIQDAEGGC